jgi:hypothetical protein
MLAIAIILGVNVLGTILFKGGDFNMFSAAALVVALFALNVTLAMVVLSLLVLVGLLVAIRETQK